VGTTIGRFPEAIISGIAVDSSRDTTSKAAGTYVCALPDARSMGNTVAVCTAATAVPPNSTSNFVELKGAA
jgi:hypothetical protein